MAVGRRGKPSRVRISAASRGTGDGEGGGPEYCQVKWNSRGLEAK